MRYRVKKDFVLEGTLLAWGDSLFLQQYQGDKKDQWEVYSLFTRKLIGIMATIDVELYLNKDESAPKEKFKRSSGNKSIRDITLLLILFILPLWGNSQEIIEKITTPDHIQWFTKMVQTGDDMFELHLSAKIDSNWFLYPLNERNKCNLCPVLKLEPNPLWKAIEGPELYYSADRRSPERCISLPIPYCPVTRYLESVLYIQVIRCKSGRNCSVKGTIEYYPTSNDSIGQMKTLMFARSLYSTSEQPITRVTVK